MIARPPISNATDSPSRHLHPICLANRAFGAVQVSTPVGLPAGEGREARRRRLGVRSKTKEQIAVTMFAAGVEKLEGLKVGKLVEQ